MHDSNKSSRKKKKLQVYTVATTAIIHHPQNGGGICMHGGNTSCFRVGDLMVDPKNHPNLLFDLYAEVNTVMYSNFQWGLYTWPNRINFLLCYDIEKSGARPNLALTEKQHRSSQVVNYIPALGAVVKRLSDGKIMDHIFVAMKPPVSGGFSAVCKQNFWDQPKNTENLLKWDKNSVEYHKGLGLFRDWIYGMDRKYNKQGLAIYVDSTTDEVFLNAELDARLDTNPLHHPEGDESRFRRIRHTGEFIRGVGWQDGSDNINAWTVLKAKGAPFLPEELHDHDPLHDAMSIGGDIRAVTLWICREKARDVVFGPAVRSVCKRFSVNHQQQQQQIII